MARFTHNLSLSYAFLFVCVCTLNHGKAGGIDYLWYCNYGSIAWYGGTGRSRAWIESLALILA